MTWTGFDTWIVVVGALAAGACGLLGPFLVLRRASMMGDAISHAVLPGLAVAFLVSGSRDSVTMLVGAAAVGILTAVLTQLVHRLGNVDEGAAMGVVFTSLFALGLVLIVRAADHVDLDPGCVLYGAIELTPLYTVNLAGWAVPQAAFTLAIVAVVDLLFVVALYKELKITSFDPDLATTLGIRAGALHYALMALVAATTVAAFEAVGSILVVAMLIVPAATAHLLTERLPAMLVVSTALAVLGAVLGHLGAITIPPLFGVPDTSTAGSMAVMTGGLFLLALAVAPRHGLLSRAGQRARLGLRIVREDALGLLYRLEEHGSHEPAAVVARRLRAALGLETVRGALITRLALAGLRRRGLAVSAGDRLELSPAGRRRARSLVRAHRLWESYLVKHIDLPPDHVHDTAMQLEHVTGEAMQEALAAQAEAGRDPHGREIPGGEGPRDGGTEGAGNDG